MLAVAHEPVAWLVVDPAGRALDRVEHYVLVVAGGHPRRQFDARGEARVELRAGVAVLPAHDLLEPIDLDEPQRGAELAHAEVEPGDREVGLAVVAKGARE